MQSCQVGASKCDITPEDLDTTNYWMAGHFPLRTAKGVSDPLYARALIIHHQIETTTLEDNQILALAIITLDLIGLVAQDIKVIQDEIVKKVPTLEGHILIHCTHNHAAPDTIGIWGGIGNVPFFNSGPKDYIKYIATKTAIAVDNAWKTKQPVELTVASFSDEDFEPDLIVDVRPPDVLDHNIRLLEFSTKSEVVATLINWSVHPTLLGPENQKISANFIKDLIDKFEQRKGGTALYVNGAIGSINPSQNWPILKTAIETITQLERTKKTVKGGKEIIRKIGNIDQVKSCSKGARQIFERIKTTAKSGKEIIIKIGEIRQINDLFKEVQEVNEKIGKRLQEWELPSILYRLRDNTLSGNPNKNVDDELKESFINIPEELLMRFEKHKQSVSQYPYIIHQKRSFFLPINNPLFLIAAKYKFINVNLCYQSEIPETEWWRPGVPLTGYCQTEANFIRLGDSISILTMGGELYPELLVGGIEPKYGIPPYNESLPELPLWENPKWKKQERNDDKQVRFFFGLVNDSYGYVIPQSQWDGWFKNQYGELLSCSADNGSIVSYNLHLLMLGFTKGYPQQQQIQEYLEDHPAYMKKFEKQSVLFWERIIHWSERIYEKNANSQT